jgi:hypothetical protein
MFWTMAFVPEAQLQAIRANTINNKHLNLILGDNNKDEESAFRLLELNVSKKRLNVNKLERQSVKSLDQRPKNRTPRTISNPQSEI